MVAALAVPGESPLARPHLGEWLTLCWWLCVEERGITCEAVREGGGTGLLFLTVHSPWIRMGFREKCCHSCQGKIP